MSRDVLTKEIFGFKKTGAIGLELEVESSLPLPNVDESPWKTKGDESLRGYGAEYVTASPLMCDATKTAAIHSLCKELEKNKGIVKGSPRTSLHVHINILDLTPLQIWTAATSYWMLDNLLVKYCGKEREGNLFCLRLKDAEGVLNVLKSDIDDTMNTGIPFDNLGGTHIRYSSQNLNAIRKFGSIEYRGKNGDIDPYVLDNWSTELYNIVHRSKRFASPEAVLNTFVATRDPLDFVSLLVSYNFARTICGKDAKKLIADNAGTLCEFAYYISWDRFRNTVNKKAVEMGFIDRKQWNEPPTDTDQPIRYTNHIPPGGVPLRAPRMPQGWAGMTMQSPARIVPDVD